MSCGRRGGTQAASSRGRFSRWRSALGAPVPRCPGARRPPGSTPDGPVGCSRGGRCLGDGGEGRAGEHVPAHGEAEDGRGGSLGLDTEGLPSKDEMGAMSGFISRLDARLLVVGGDDDTDWRVAGQLDRESVHGDLEGRARVVGKVTKVIPVGRWKPYLTFPGMKPRVTRGATQAGAPGARTGQGERVPRGSGDHAGHPRDLPLTQAQPSAPLTRLRNGRLCDTADALRGDGVRPGRLVSQLACVIPTTVGRL